MAGSQKSIEIKASILVYSGFPSGSFTNLDCLEPELASRHILLLNPTYPGILIGTVGVAPRSRLIPARLYRYQRGSKVELVLHVEVIVSRVHCSD